MSGNPIKRSPKSLSATWLFYPRCAVYQTQNGIGLAVMALSIWPTFSIEASSVASPYTHETSRKVAEVFTAAIKAAPSVVIIDEMDAFLASRDGASNQHNVEEVAEFLRRVPEATAKRVLVIGMINQIDAIDAAILRRGRFDHVIHVDHAGECEVCGLLMALLKDIPPKMTDISGLARQLTASAQLSFHQQQVTAYCAASLDRYFRLKIYDRIFGLQNDRLVDFLLSRLPGESDRWAS